MGAARAGATTGRGHGSSAAEPVDVVVVGAGILGLATAWSLTRRDRHRSVVVLDKERCVAAHQSGHNSGVIHAGVYYRPGSEKAARCRTGRTELMAYCERKGIPFHVCGKLIVATTSRELEPLEDLQTRCRHNGVETRLVDRRTIAELEPHVDGIAALHVPATGVVDFARVCAALADDLREHGVAVHLGTAVTGLREDADGVAVDTTNGSWHAARVVNCAGVHSDRLAAMGAPAPGADARRRRGARDRDRSTPIIVPFRGEYYELVESRRDLVRHLVYPVADPRFPFLGVHFTRDINGHVHAGPNAVPALGRESYDWRTFNAGDVLDMARRPATWHLAARYWRTEIDEVARSLSKARFVTALQRLVPDVREADLVRAGAGIRAQAVAADGSLLDDFAFVQSPRIVTVLNAPSPGATASLALGASIADRVLALR